VSATTASLSADQRSHREHSARLLNTAIEIADTVVRSEIECYAVGSEHGGHLWWNIQDIDWRDEVIHAVAARAIDNALKYIGLRSPDAFPWTLLRHPERPELVRFEDKPQP